MSRWRPPLAPNAVTSRFVLVLCVVFVMCFLFYGSLVATVPVRSWCGPYVSMVGAVYEPFVVIWQTTAAPRCRTPVPKPLPKNEL